MDDAAPNPNCPGCQALSKRVARLEREIEELKALVRRNSRNSNRPPSSDPPWLKPPSGTGPSTRSRGGQPGHEKSEREVLPPDAVECCKPPACAGCGAALSGKDHAPSRHQVTEIPAARASVVEYELHTLKCRACGHKTRANLPEGVPRGSFGPRLQSMVVLLSGVYRVSRRNVQQLLADAFGVEMSLGAISNIEGVAAEMLEAPHQETLQAIRRAGVVYSDETGWREANESAWLWTANAEGLSAFVIRPSRGSDVAKELLGEDFDGAHVSDRYSGYDWINIEQRQVCWAHLIRDFRKIAESGGTAVSIGDGLGQQAKKLFLLWHRVRDGTLMHPTFVRRAGRIRAQMQDLLELGARCDSLRAASLCRGIQRLESAMWTFVTHDGVEPTNNTAERALRSGVIWRKTSFGTQSPRGSRFVERILTCVATLRQRGRNVLDYLTSANDADVRGAPIPSFLR